MPADSFLTHKPYFQPLHHREVNELYISIALRFLALGMVGIFLPIYLLFELKLSLPIVMYFFIVFAAVLAISALWGASIATKIGFKHLILISIPFQITFLFLLSLLPSFKIPLFLVSIVGAISHGLYWMGYHTDLARFSIRKKRGEEVGLAFFISEIVAIMGPVVGGLILTFFNFTVLFITGSLILLASTIPLFFSKDFYEKKTFSPNKIFKERSLREATAFIAQGIELGSRNILWPLFIFFILKGYLSLGLIGTLASILTASFCFIVGKFSDNIGRRFFLRIGSFSLISLWFFRTLIKTIQGVYFITIFSFIPAFTSVPLDTLAYNKAKHSKRIPEYLVFREIFINLGKILAFIAMLLTASYVTTFIFTGISQIALLFF